MPENSRLCRGCGKAYPATTEHFSPDGKGLQSRCKTCRAELQRIATLRTRQYQAKHWYKTHPEEFETAKRGHFFSQKARQRWADYSASLPAINRKVKEKKLKNRDFILEYKRTHPCEICGESHPACLDFHHRDTGTKEFEISRWITVSRTRLIREIEKCQVLCANCHRKLHWDIEQLDISA